MKQLTPEQFAQYSADPLGMDAVVRTWGKVPEDRYYSVSTWPEHLAGRLYVNDKMFRVVKATKISKSNQPS